MEIDLPILIFSNPTKLAIQSHQMRDDYSNVFFPFKKYSKKFFMDIAIWKLIYLDTVALHQWFEATWMEILQL